MKPARLLYPVEQKDYTSDPFIAKQWEKLRIAFQGACVLTLFGYGAPTSDVEAVSLMHDAWGRAETRQLEQVEIIDTKSRQELASTWSAFICRGHYETSDDFYQSWIVKHPRTTCEAVWNQFMEIRDLTDNPIPKASSFEELRDWLQPLLAAERRRAD